MKLGNLSIPSLQGIAFSDHPYSHAVIAECLPQDLFQRLAAEFPSAAWFESNKEFSFNGGRINLENDTPVFDKFLQSSPAWRDFHEAIVSEDFVRAILDQIRPKIVAAGGKSALTRFHFVKRVDHFTGGFTAKVMRRLWRFCRMLRLNEPLLALRRLIWGERLYVDFHVTSARAGYEVEPHTDNRNKIFVMLIYFNSVRDADDRLVAPLYIDQLRKPSALADCERFPPKAAVDTIATVEVSGNKAVCFVNANNAYHEVPAWRSEEARNALYIAIAHKDHESFWKTNYHILYDQQPRETLASLLRRTISTASEMG